MKTLLIYYSSFFMIYFGSMTFFCMKKHILMMLLSLEFLTLTIMLMIMNFLSVYIYDTMIMVYFVIIMVCEAVMGLILLTLIVRTHGSDYFKSLVIIKC